MTRNVARALYTALFMATVVAGCDNPVGDGQSHIVPRTIIIRANTDTLIRGPRTAITGTLTTRVGTETAPLTVEFLDANGNLITPPAEYHLDIVVDAAGSAIARWEPTTAGAFGGRVRGLAPGSTTFRFEFKHGPVGTGHAEATFSVPVTISP